MSNAISRSISLLTIVLCSACGSQDPGHGGTEGGAAAANLTELMPWKAGNSWTYLVARDGILSEKVTTIGAEEPVGGSGPNAALLANRVETLKKNGTDNALSWQAKVGDQVVRYRELAYAASTGLLELEEHWDPFKLRIDNSPEHWVEGATWVAEYQETKIPYGEDGAPGNPVTTAVKDVWCVQAVDIAVTVPAGTFDAVVLKRTGAQNEKVYFFVPGVGKVKEVGGQSEELVSYVVDP